MFLIVIFLGDESIQFWNKHNSLVTETLFHHWSKNIIYLPQLDVPNQTFHRAVKQLCGICRFMARDSYVVTTHILCSLQAFICLELMNSEKIIYNWYELQDNLFTRILREYIFNHLSSILNMLVHEVTILSILKF